MEIRKKRNKLSASTSLNKLPSAYFLLTACSLALLGPPLVVTAPPQGLWRNCVPCDNTGSHTSVCSILPHWCFQTIMLCPMQTTPPNARSDIHQHLSLFAIISGSPECSRRNMGYNSQHSPPCQLLRLTCDLHLNSNSITTCSYFAACNYSLKRNSETLCSPTTVLIPSFSSPAL